MIILKFLIISLKTLFVIIATFFFIIMLLVAYEEISYRNTDNYNKKQKVLKSTCVKFFNGCKIKQTPYGYKLNPQKNTFGPMINPCNPFRRSIINLKLGLKIRGRDDSLNIVGRRDHHKPPYCVTLENMSADETYEYLKNNPLPQREP